MIEARRITKFFSVTKDDGTAEGATVVLSVSLKIQDGSFVTIVGPTGCGKSTFLEILAGLQAPTEGEVYIDGRLVLEPLPSTRKEMDAYRRKYRFVSPLANGIFRNRPKHDIAMVFQDYAIFPWMTARENVLFTLKLRGAPRSDREDLVRHYLDQVGLRGSAHKYPSQLSGGMRQRLAIARALSVEPKIILMDEPFAAVDALTRERLQEMLLEIWSTTRTTMVMVTHDFDEAVYLADEVIVFSPQPGSIRNRVSIDLPRPRHRDDPLLRSYRERIVRMYQYDTVHAADYSI